MKRKNEKDHRSRKSMGSAELRKKQNKTRNATRPKQRWIPVESVDMGDGEILQTGGYWSRTIAGQPEN